MYFKLNSLKIIKLDETLTANRFLSIDNALTIMTLIQNQIKIGLNIGESSKIFRYRKRTFNVPNLSLSDGYVFHLISNLIPSKSYLMLSNSFPIRDMALFGNYDGKHIYVNRGTAG